MRKLVNQITLNLESLRKELSTAKATFCEQDEYDNGDDIIYDIPQVYSVDKYGYYTLWCVLRIENGIAYCGGLCEDQGDTMDTELSQLSDSEILTIANELI
mgnify:CR=1 FL=1